MKKFCHWIVSGRWVIIIVCAILMIPAVIGYGTTRINYDLINYLPQNTETIVGENILVDEFGMGGYSLVITNDLSPREILALEKEMKKIDGVNKVGSVYDVIGTTIPIEMLPSKLVKSIKVDQSNLLIVTFWESMSNDRTLSAVKELRALSGKLMISGMTASTLDTATVADNEVIMYVIIAVLLCLIVLQLSLDSFFVPFILLGNIGVSIIFNMGTNFFFGEISYITKAIAAVLQLGVTMDFSIFLYHKYEKWKKEPGLDRYQAMEEAIAETMVSVVGSSTTTIAGFLALCTMDLTLGVDIGVVMAKGVAFGVVTVCTLFPALILVTDKLIVKTGHREVIPQFTFMRSAVRRAYKVIFILFLVLLMPAYICQTRTKNYYNLTAGLPKYLEGVQANDALMEKFNIISQYAVLVDVDLPASQVKHMVDEIDALDGIDLTLSYASIAAGGISDDSIPKDFKAIFNSGKHQLIMINSAYEKATPEVNEQIGKVDAIAKSYDPHALLCGEAPLCKDLIKTADHDFKSVNYTSIAVVFVLMLLVLRSFSLPVLLVTAIEFAIFINMGIPYLTGVEIPFVAGICLGTIQLGATIDYAILMSTKYLEIRKQGADKFEAVDTAMANSVNSIFVSAMCFFAATVGVGFYSNQDMISTICIMIARGAVISMLVVGFVVPSILLVCDKVIVKTTLGFKKKTV